MPDTLVRTKLIRPRPRGRTVSRPRLDDRLLLGSTTALTLISAPAGFGKTTLLGSWLVAGRGGPTAWVSLDERDRDPTTFWSYVLLAVDRAAPGTAAEALAHLQSGRAPLDAMLTMLLNELSVLPTELTLVLDDYHLAEGPDLQPGMVFLLDHLPPQVHVVISSRADPALPLSRLRARGQLLEIRASDLRFTLDETATYLNEVNALDLAAEDVAALEGRTEGWAAALQLAALSLQGRRDRSRFIAGFAGDDRFVVDYLADEVLDRQPPEVRCFLLETSVLERLAASVCGAVTGRCDGAAMLEGLERSNLFLVPLDDHRGWYRYHHLFRDVLQARLLDERPDDVARLHRRAGAWFDEAGQPEAAVRHALAAGDLDSAADRVELAIPTLRRARREDVIRRWVDQLPAAVVRNRPVLAVGLLGALAASNRFDGLAQRLRDVEQLLGAPDQQPVIVDQAEWTRLPALLATYRAALALVGGDPAETVRHARIALDLAGDDDLLTPASAAALIGLACWTEGDLDGAHQAYRAAADGLERTGHVADVLGCTITIADLEVAQGRLLDARRTCERAMALAEREASPPRGTADMHVALSVIALESGDVGCAAEHLSRADVLGEAGGLPQNPYRWRVALAWLREAQGDAATGVGLLEEAERVYVGDFSPQVRPIAAVRARMLAAGGEVAAALAWARRRGVSATDPLTYLREYEHVTLARILLADNATSGHEAALLEATGLLDRLLEAAEGGGRTRVVLEVLALQSLARAAAGHQAAALESLERAVRLAEPEGWVRVFTGEGAPMAKLLRSLQSRHRSWLFLRTLITAAPARAAGAPPGSGGETPSGQSLVEPLSSRELDVLRYLRSDLDGPAIARELGVSLSTVRTHTQRIFTKLGVANRRAAVRHAHQLNLFAGR